MNQKIDIIVRQQKEYEGAIAKKKQEVEELNAFIHSSMGLNQGKVKDLESELRRHNDIID